MNYGSLTQIGILIVAVAIIFTYIKPTFSSIATIQASTDQYQAALDKTSEFNATLRRLVGEVNSFSPRDMKATETYLPATIDEVQVLADLAAIARQSGVSISSMNAGATTSANTGVVLNNEAVATNGSSIYQDFNVTIAGSYEAMKVFVGKLAQNKYPLEVIGLTFGNTVDSGNTKVVKGDVPLGSYAFILRTYGYSYQP